MRIVGGVHRASDTDMEDARLELLEKHQPSNMMMFGRPGYILLIATAGTTIQVEALPVGGAPRLTTIVPRFQVTPLLLLTLLSGKSLVSATQCLTRSGSCHSSPVGASSATCLSPITSVRVLLEPKHYCTFRHSHLVVNLHFACSLAPWPVARNCTSFLSILSAGSDLWMRWVCCLLDRLLLSTTLSFVTARIQVRPSASFGMDMVCTCQLLARMPWLVHHVVFGGATKYQCCKDMHVSIVFCIMTVGITEQVILFLWQVWQARRTSKWH